jgi:DNA-binding winged helix-turn-helix (wHTH) protein/predicted Ser/Thr protein kinase
MSNRSFRGIRTIRFNDFELDVRAFELRREGSRVRLQEQPLRILTALLERPGEVISRDEIRKRLWPNDTAVEVSHGINAAVQRLREALGESAENPRFIETLARRGYRFIAPVQIGLRTPSGTTADGVVETPPPPEVSHFRVLERLGVGGMGVVYRAEDQKLGRHVALKFLPDDLAKDPASLARFRREAQAASALNHPNICTIYGVEECDGKPVIVMEYIEGESLEAALARGPMPVEKAVSAAVQMAGALDAAHRAGIVHRDLKPGNVIVTAAGVKVLDFGLAKMERPPMLGFEPPHVTKEGSILGTLHYLSPEQVQGKPAEASSDIFSFGVVLYEMLAGRRAFDGPNTARVMAAILALEPPPLGTAIPQALDMALRRCLAKEPEERWQSARDLKAALELLPKAGESQPARRSVARLGARWWAVGVMGALLLAWAVWHLDHWGGATPRPTRALVEQPMGAAQPLTGQSRAKVAYELERPISSLEAPPTVSAPLAGAARPASVLLPGAAVMRLNLSPDGKRVAYVSRGHLWIAGIGGEEPVMYDEAVGTPFWSPDGRYVAASTGRELRRFEVGTQNTTSICAVNTTFSGAWNKSGTILIGLQRDGLYRVQANGGTMQRVTSVDASRGETRHLASQFLPDGLHFLYVAGSNVAGRSMVYAGSLGSQERTAIMPASSNVAYAEGYLVYSVDSMMAARRFDWKTLRASGDPVMLGESAAGEVAADAAVSMAHFSVAGNTLALGPLTSQRERITVVKNWVRGLK